MWATRTQSVSVLLVEGEKYALQFYNWSRGRTGALIHQFPFVVSGLLVGRVH